MTTGRLRPPLQFYAGGVIAPSKANERRIEMTIALEMLSPPDRRFSASLRNRSARAGHTSPKVLPPSLEGVHHLYHHHPRDCRTIPEITVARPFFIMHGKGSEVPPGQLSCPAVPVTCPTPARWDNWRGSIRPASCPAACPGQMSLWLKHFRHFAPARAAPRGTTQLSRLSLAARRREDSGPLAGGERQRLDVGPGTVVGGPLRAQHWESVQTHIT